MIKRSFSVMMLALIAAPTYAVYGEQDDLPKAPEGMVKIVKRVVDGASDLKDIAIGTVQKVVGSSKVDADEQKENSESTKKPGNVFNVARQSIDEHVGPTDEAPTNEGDDSQQAPSEKPKNGDTPAPSEGSNESEEPKVPVQETKHEQAQPNIFSRTLGKVGNGLVWSKNTFCGVVGAAGAFAFNSGKFAIKTVDPRTYWNAGKAVFKGQEGVSRFAIIQGHKEAVTGIVAATLATVGYVYYDEIVDGSKKAYNWTKDQMQSFKAYIQG